MTAAPAVKALVAMLTRYARLAPDQVWFAQRQGALAMVSGVPFATLNGVWVIDETADPAEVTDLLQTLPVRDLAYSLNVCPARCATFAQVAEVQRMVRGPDVPLMVLTEAPAAWLANGLTIRELHRDEFDARTEVSAASYGVSPPAIRHATALAGRLPGYRMYLAESHGAVVTTAVGITDGEATGVFDVATPPQYRGRGYGTAITAHTIREGFATGARWAWLQSSPEGLGVYERIGFRTVQDWGQWVSADSK